MALLFWAGTDGFQPWDSRKTSSRSSIWLGTWLMARISIKDYREHHPCRENSTNQEIVVKITGLNLGNKSIPVFAAEIWVKEKSTWCWTWVRKNPEHQIKVFGCIRKVLGVIKDFSSGTWCNESRMKKISLLMVWNMETSDKVTAKALVGSMRAWL